MGHVSKSEWEYTDDKTGNVTSSGWSTSATGADGSTTTTDVFFSHGADGEINGTIQDTETKDESGEVTEQTRTVWNEDGSGSETKKNSDGTTTITTFDENGNVLEVHHYDAEGNEIDPPKQGNGDFWDADIIYGDHDEDFGHDIDFGSNGKNVAAQFDAKAMMEHMGDHAAEAYVDSFDFIF